MNEEYLKGLHSYLEIEDDYDTWVSSISNNDEYLKGLHKYLDIEDDYDVWNSSVFGGEPVSTEIEEVEIPVGETQEPIEEFETSWQPTRFNEQGEVDVEYYESLPLISVEKNEFDKWMQNQTVDGIDKRATRIKLPSEIAQEVEDQKQIEKNINDQIQNNNILNSKNEEELWENIVTSKQDAVSNDAIIKQEIEKINNNIQTEFKKSQQEIINKYNLQGLASEIASKYDLTNAIEVEKAQQEYEKEYDARMQKANIEIKQKQKQLEDYYNSSFKRLQESRLFSDRLNKINKDFENTINPYITQWQRSNTGGIPGAIFSLNDELKEASKGTIFENVVNFSSDVGESVLGGFLQTRKSLIQASISTDDAIVAKVYDQLKNAKDARNGLGIKDNETVYVYPSGNIDFAKSNIAPPTYLKKGGETPGQPRFNLKGELVTTEKGVYGELESKPMKFSDYKEMQKAKQDRYRDRFKINLEDLKKFDDVIDLIPKADFEDADGMSIKDIVMTVGEMTPLLASGTLGFTLAPVTAGGSLVASTMFIFGNEYGNNYWEALETGLRKEIKEKEGVDRNPTNEEIIDALINDKYTDKGTAAGWAAISTLLETGTGIRSASGLKGLKNTLEKVAQKSGYSSLKEMFVKTGKNNFKDMLKDGGKTLTNIGKNGIKEYFTEGAQSLANQASISQAGGETAIQNLDLKQAMNEAKVGGVVGAFIPGVKSLTIGYSRAKNFITQEAYKVSIGKVKAEQFDKFFNNASKALDDLKNNNKITREEYVRQSQELSNLKNLAVKIPKEFGIEARQKSLDLMLERQNLQDRVKNEDEAFTKDAKERISEINEELGKIQAVEVATKKAVKAVEKADVDINIIELENQQEVENYIKENTNIAASKAKEAGKQRGFIMPDGKTVVINKDIATKEAAYTTAGHEILHAVLYNTINKGDQNTFALANAIRDQLTNINTSDFKNSELATRIEQYKSDPEISQVEKAEELLTLFSEAIETGDIKFNESIFTKLKDFVRRILQNAGFSKIDFKSSKDVYNFIKDYNRSIRKGKFTKAQVKAAKEGIKVSEDLIKPVKEIIEKGVDKTVLKFSKKASDKVQEIYNDQGVAGALDIIQEFKPIVNKIVERRKEAPGFDRQLLTDEIETGERGILDLIQAYDPKSGVPLAAYVNKFLPSRAIEASQRVLGEVFEGDITERVDIAEPTTAVEEVEITEKPKAPVNLRRALDIEKGSDLYNKVKDVVAKTFGTKIPSPTDPKFKKTLQDTYATELTNDVKELMGKPSSDKYKTFLQKYGEQIYDLIPQDILNKSYQDFIIERKRNLSPTEVDDAISKGLLPSDTPRNSGPSLFTKKPYNQEEFVEFHLAPKKGRPASKQTQLAQTIAKELGKDATLEVLEDPKVFERFTEVQEIEGKKVTKETKPKVAEKIQREPGIKFSINNQKVIKSYQKIAQAKDINKAISNINVTNVTITNKNRFKKITSNLNFIKKGKIGSATFELAKLGNFGRDYEYGKIINGSFVKKSKLLGGKKYFKTIDGDYILSTDKKANLKYDGKDKITNWQPSRGSLFYGKTDPNYIEALKAAKKNDSEPINKKLKELKVRKVTVKDRITSSFIKANKNQSDTNMDALKLMALNLQEAVHKYKMPIEDASLFLTSGYQATSGILKIAAPFKYVSKVFEYATIGKTNQKTGRKFIEEHNPPASVVGTSIILAIKNNQVKDIFPFIRKNYYQTQLSKADDALLDTANLDSTLPEGTSVLDNPIKRLATAGINLSTIINPLTNKNIAEENGYGVPKGFDNMPDLSADQNKAILSEENIDKKVLKNNTKFSKSRENSRVNNIENIKNSKVILTEDNMTNEDVINKAATLDNALANARKLDAPVKKIRVFDFDDTLARTKSIVFYTKPDGTEGQLTAEQFAEKGADLVAEGAVMDFSDFNIVREGTRGPLFDVAKNIRDARGNEDLFVLTARAPESADAIYEFLKSEGLEFKRENIVGLGNSTGAAKANWIVDKAAEGYNDFYFADDAPQNVKAVRDAMSLLDVRAKTQLAKDNRIKFSKSGSKKLDWRIEKSPYGDGMVANFKIKDKNYLVTLYPIDTKGDYRYQFELETKTGSTQKITGTGDAISVFSTVYKGLLDAIKSNPKIKRVEFSADKSEPSRVRVYTSVMDRFAKDLGWNTDIWETTDWDGGGSFDFELTKPRKKRVKAVQDVLDVVDVKSKVQQAKVKFSKSINEDFNKIIEQKTGIASEKRYSKAKAKVRGANKGNKKFFIPYSAEDFMGLVYPLLSKGKLGDSQMAWFKEHLLDPYGRAIENLSSDRIQMMQDFKQLKKSLEVPKDLRKTNDSGFTNEQAVRVYLFNKMGYEVPGLSKTDLSELVDIVNSDGKLKAFADQILSVTKGDGYVKPSQEWLTGTITTDLIDLLNTTKRRKYLEQSGYLDNANEIFSTENLNKLEAAYGVKYREAMENILSRMKSGKNRMFSGNRLSNRVLDYINGSIGTIMFFNTRSAVLQTISSINFLNWSFNNPYKAGKAFANQKQYWKDFKMLMNSDYLTDRRNGLKLNINENEIANAAATAKNKARGVMNYILQKGYLPTQFADSFAIASGGATFYRNRVNDLVSQGLELKQAEQQALSEWKETAEISQQSSDPSKISQQQASDLGRVILAFANTPMQYARIQKRAFQDLVNKRGDAKTNASKIIYYGVVQNLIFNALQQALFAIGFGDDEDEKNEKKYLGVANGMLDSTLRGLGIAGATVAVIKNFLMDIYERSGRKRPEYVDSVYKLLQLSPPISSKISKIRQAAYQFDSKKRREEIFEKGFSLDNPAYEAAAKIISATTNLPLDRVLNKVNNIEAALGEDAETWQIIAMLAGWPEWQIMAKEKKKEELPKFEGAKVKTPSKTKTYTKLKRTKLQKQTM